MRLHHLALSFAAAFVALALAQPARANVMIIIDKSAQRMTVTVDGEQLYTWPVSTGQRGYDTPAGEFTAVPHGAATTSAASGTTRRCRIRSSSPSSGHAIHGTDHKNLGRPASHGCVRLEPEHAATLFALVKEEGVFNARVRLIGVTPKTADVPVARREPAKDRDSCVTAIPIASGARAQQRPRGGTNHKSRNYARHQPCLRS